MRLSHNLIIAGALLAATPALAQDNAAAPANAAATSNTTDANAATAQADLNSAAVPPESSNASPGVATSADTGTTTGVRTKHGFPWGVLGLLGLVGLMGVRKVKS